MKKEICSLLSFYAISPIHAGSGASVATVDLPIQRERHTGYPNIQASGVKGALRDHFRKFFKNDNSKSYELKGVDGLLNRIFGYDEQDDEKKTQESIPASISISDAKLLAFPMRSNIAPFVWVTSPTILKRLARDLEYLDKNSFKVDFEITEDKALALIEDFSDKEIILEDAVVEIKKWESEDKKLIEFIKKNFPEIDKLLLISDDMFDYCVSSCTEIQTNIKIDSETGTAKDGGLRYQEFLPADTLLYSIVYFGNTQKDLTAKMIKEIVMDTINDFIQIGGDESLGKGICKIKWINGGE